MLSTWTYQTIYLHLPVGNLSLSRNDHTVMVSYSIINRMAWVQILIFSYIFVKLYIISPKLHPGD